MMISLYILAILNSSFSAGEITRTKNIQASTSSSTVAL